MPSFLMGYTQVRYSSLYYLILLLLQTDFLSVLFGSHSKVGITSCGIMIKAQIVYSPYFMIKTYVRSCVVQPVRDTVCYLHEPTFSCLQHKNYWADFNQNQVLDALQSHYPTVMFVIFTAQIREIHRRLDQHSLLVINNNLTCVQ